MRFSFPLEELEVAGLGADDAGVDPADSPAARFPAETKTLNPVSKKDVKKTAAKSEPKSLRWVNTRINSLAATCQF